MKSCSSCKHMEMFKRVDGNLYLWICSAEQPYEEDEGLLNLVEVSQFDATHCGMYLERTTLNKGLKELVG